MKIIDWLLNRTVKGWVVFIGFFTFCGLINYGNTGKFWLSAATAFVCAVLCLIGVYLIDQYA